MREIITQKRNTYLPPNRLGIRLHVAFEVGDNVRYTYDDEIINQDVTIKFNQILVIKEVCFWREKNSIRYIVKIGDTEIGLKDHELELV